MHPESDSAQHCDRTSTRGGRSIAIHAQEALRQTKGPRARYKGVRKNTLDLRRVAVIVDLVIRSEVDSSATRHNDPSTVLAPA
jgi:hypothetical protein